MLRHVSARGALHWQHDNWPGACEAAYHRHHGPREPPNVPRPHPSQTYQLVNSNGGPPGLHARPQHLKTPTQAQALTDGWREIPQPSLWCVSSIPLHLHPNRHARAPWRASQMAFGGQLTSMMVQSMLSTAEQRQCSRSTRGDMAGSSLSATMDPSGRIFCSAAAQSAADAGKVCSNPDCQRSARRTMPADRSPCQRTYQWASEQVTTPETRPRPRQRFARFARAVGMKVASNRRANRAA